MKSKTFNYKKSVAYVFLSSLFALAFSGWLGEYLQHQGIIEGQYRYLLQGILMSGIVLGSIVLVRKNVDHYHPMDIGVSNWKSAFRNFGLGAAMVLIPFTITLILSQLFNWTTYAFHISGEVIITVIVGIITVLLFEALPEELAFRGYIFGALKTKNGLWTSGLITVLLFVLVPILLHPIQKYLIGMNDYIIGQGGINVGYLITMLFFGSFVMFLRILSGSIWLTVGFHCFFVFINRLIGITDTSVIQILDESSGTSMQMTLIICFLLMATVVIGSTYLKKSQKTKLATQNG